MKNKATKTATQLSKEQLETIVGGPETSRGTKTEVTD
jgi:bacteriocin-like protein